MIKLCITYYGLSTSIADGNNSGSASLFLPRGHEIIRGCGMHWAPVDVRCGFFSNNSFFQNVRFRCYYFVSKLCSVSRTLQVLEYRVEIFLCFNWRRGRCLHCGYVILYVRIVRRVQRRHIVTLSRRYRYNYSYAIVV